MQVLETLIRALDGCVGLLEVMALIIDALAVYLGVKTLQKHRHAALPVHHSKAPPKKPAWWPPVVLLTLAAGLTFLTLWKYLFMQR
jgi:hypothetical protein